MSDPMTVFDRRAVRLHRDRAAAGLAGFDFLFAEVGERLLDRLDDITRRFPRALDLGCHGDILAGRLAGRGGIETLVACDLFGSHGAPCRPPGAGRRRGAAAVSPAAFSTSCSAIFRCHWVNDPPGRWYRSAARSSPTACSSAPCSGGATCRELRQALAEAESAVEGGLSPRVSPLAEVRDAGNLLQRAGFALPVADSDTLTVSYADPLKLMADLRGMGEANAVLARRKTLTRRAMLAAAAERYSTLFAAADDGRVPATFEVIYLTAWAPHPSQQKPARPGSAGARLADALGTAEIPAGDKARPR